MTRRDFLAALAAAAWISGSRAGAGEATLTLAQVVPPLRRASPLADWILARALGPPPRVPLLGGEVAFGRFHAEAMVDGRAPSDLVGAANVLVHEAAHYLSPILAAQRDPRAFGQAGTVGLVVAPGAVCVVPGQPVFPSREAIPAFPAFLRAGHRFETYIASEGDSMVTQQYGVFGLLEELAAYHAGTRAALDLVRSLARQPRGSADDWVARLAGVDATVAAWPEFRGYILAWLAYARKQHPEVYARTAGSAPLRAAWRKVDGAFGAVCRAWYRDVPGLVAGLHRAGIAVRLLEDGVFAGRRGRRLFRKEYDALMAGLAASPELRAVEAALARS